MIRGTTPTFTLKLKNKDGTPCEIDLREASNIYFTVSQGSTSITKKAGEDLELVDGKTVHVFLNQEESLRLREGQKTELQLNWTYIDVDGNTRRAATVVRDIGLDKQLIRKVIE